MNISVVITCLNEEQYIGPCLLSIVNQDFKQGAFEIIVSDGRSADGTREIVTNLAEQYPQIRLVTRSKPDTATGRNVGVQKSRYDFICFIDADCIAPADWLRVLVEGYLSVKRTDPNVVAVGGTNKPPKNSGRFIESIGVALDSYAGSFRSVQGRQFDQITYVSSLSTVNALYEKEKILNIGGFDESLASEAEDAELNYRLYKGGCRFIYIPESYVWHYMRSSPIRWAKNMFRYGKGRARLLKRYPQMWCFSFLLPVCFIACMGLLTLSPISVLFCFPLLYFPIIIGFSFRQCIRKKCVNIVALVCWVYILQHFSYAVGEVYGLLSPKVR